MQEKPARRNSGKFEQLRQIRAVEQLRTIDKEIEMVSGLISSLSGFYIDAWRDLIVASRRIKHALFVLDDSGDSEHIIEKHYGV